MGAFLAGDRIIVDDEPTITKLEQKGYGKRVDKKLELSLIEGLFLLERKSIKLENKKAADLKNLLKGKKRDFLRMYRVYQDLRERGYVVKTGFKYGAHFRVYERGEYAKEHSKFLVYAVPENYTFSFPEVSRAVRLAHGVKKTMIFAVVDDEGDITYYTVERIMP